MIRSTRMKGALVSAPQTTYKTLVPTEVEVSVLASAKMTAKTPAQLEPPGGLFPLQTKAFEMDEYRIMAGWPVAVPQYDIRCHTMVSGDGEKFAVRDDNTAIETNALVRWVADPDFYDETELVWKPMQDKTGHQSVWETSVEYAPVLINNYEYRVGSERFIESALNFDSDTQNHMWGNFADSFGGSTGYSVVMVMSPNSVYGNDADVPYNGLWCPGGPPGEGDTFEEDPGDTWASVSLQGGYLYFETHANPRKRAISIHQQLNSNAPMYLAFCINPIESVFYVGFGSESVKRKAMPTHQALDPQNSGILLGRTTGDVLHTADMALFDLGIYASRLNAKAVKNEFAKLSRAYGGSE